MAIEGDKLIEEINAKLQANVKAFKMLADLRAHIENGGECYHPQTHSNLNGHCWCAICFKDI